MLCQGPKPGGTPLNGYSITRKDSLAHTNGGVAKLVKASDCKPDIGGSNPSTASNKKG